MNYPTKKTIQEYSLNYLLKDFDLTEDDGYDFSGKLESLDEDVVDQLSPKKFIIINEDFFPVNQLDTNIDDLKNTCIFTSELLNNFLIKDGYLIIIGAGENFIDQFVNKYLGNIYKYVLSVKDKAENDNLREAAESGSRSLAKIRNRYGLMMKYYVLKKERYTSPVEIIVPEKEEGFIDDIEVWRGKEKMNWEAQFFVKDLKYRMSLTTYLDTRRYRGYLSRFKERDVRIVYQFNEPLKKWPKKHDLNLIKDLFIKEVKVFLKLSELDDFKESSSGSI